MTSISIYSASLLIWKFDQDILFKNPLSWKPVDTFYITTLSFSNKLDTKNYYFECKILNIDIQVTKANVH